MKKSWLAVAVVAVCAVVGGAPVTAHAAQAGVVASGGNYVIYGGQGIGCLQETLEQIWAGLGNGSNCPELPGMPQKPGGGLPEEPGTEGPGVGLPEGPGTQEPGVGLPEGPDVQEPDAGLPEGPDVQGPGAELPGGPGVGLPEGPGDEALDGVHSYVKRVVELVNEERARAGLSALELDMGITAAANVRAVEIKQSFSHTRPDGSSFSTALKEQGVSYRGSGENIAWGQKSPEQVMSAWMNSEGHRANILNAAFRKIGIGYYQDQNGVNYWVQLFTY